MKTKTRTAETYFRTVFLACLIASPISWSAEQYRDFSDTQGRTIKGEVVAYNAANKRVTIRRTDDKEVTVPVTVFSEKDQEYIREWGFEDDFKKKLMISAKLLSNDASSEGYSVRESTAIPSGAGYELTLENKSNKDFGKIIIEYCIFYRQGKRSGSTTTYKEGVLYGQNVVSEMKSASEITFKTNTVNLQTSSGSQSIFGQDDTSTDDIRGIWLRLKTTLPSGRETIRDFRTSQDPRWKWTTYSINPNSSFMSNIPGPPIIL